MPAKIRKTLLEALQVYYETYIEGEVSGLHEEIDLAAKWVLEQPIEETPEFADNDGYP